MDGSVETMLMIKEISIALEMLKLKAKAYFEKQKNRMYLKPPLKLSLHCEDLFNNNKNDKKERYINNLLK